MSSDDTESDHDYMGDGLRNLSQGENHNAVPMLVLRLLQSSTAQEVNDSEQSSSDNAVNSDHNYINLYPVENMNSSNLTISLYSGTEESDHDIVLERDEVTDSSNDRSSVSTTFESDTRSEDSISTVSTNSSQHTNTSEHSNFSYRTNYIERISESSTSSTIHSERDHVPNLQDIAQESNITENYDENVVNVTSPSPPKKRKRLSLEEKEKGTPKVKEKDEIKDNDDDDDGLTCPICLDNWEMSGDHRLASLKCGHLFGNSCIRRWLQESSRQSGQRVCPQCKAKSNPREIRYLYAKRLRAIDRSEEHRLREELAKERSTVQNLSLEVATLKMSYAQVLQKLKNLESDNDSLNVLLRNGGGISYKKAVSQKPSAICKLYMERNIEISREPGCRVLTYASQHTSLIVSQKSCQGLFPGYGLRFVDSTTFKPKNFVHTSAKLIRDISLSDDQQLLAAASMENKVKLFDLRTATATATFNPAEKPIWSCSLGEKSNENYLYLGSQHGSIYVYDVRRPETFIDEHQAECDLSPVIQVASVPVSQVFPFGGFVVCKLTSLWFYEHTGNSTLSTRLPIEGRFISMDFNPNEFSLLIQTRSCMRHRRARYILGSLHKVNNIPVFDIKITFFASTNSPVMARCSQITVESNTLISAYIQDSKLLSLYDVCREQCIQSLPVQDIIYDTCPIYTNHVTYLAALTETKCRLYKVNNV